MSIEKNTLIKLGSDYLKKYNIVNCDNISRWIYDSFECENVNKSKFFKKIKSKVNGQPLDKIIGYTMFYDVKILFSKNTLTPRQETEFLSDRIIKDINLKKDKSIINILDLCCGSGCIGLSIGYNTDAILTLSDISSKALNMAKKNLTINNKTNKIKINPRFIKSNLFDKVDGKYDIIVSNPPYINEFDMNNLEKEVKFYDPKISLYGGKDGLDFYRKIIKDAPKYLNDSGVLYLEIGYDQSKAVVDLLKDEFEIVDIIKDYAKIDRFIVAKKRDIYVK